MNLAKTKKIIQQYLTALLLLVFFVSEAFSKYFIYFDGGKSDIPRMIKTAVFVFLGVALLKNTKIILYTVVLFVSFSIGQFFLNNGFQTEILVSFSKYLFPVFLFAYFSKYSVSRAGVQFLFKTFEHILVFNGILIFLGLLFEIYFFKSYVGARFGYNGIFINTSTSSYIYAIAIFYFLLKYKDQFLKNWKSLLIIICSLLTGTKILYLFILGALIMYVYSFLKISKQQRNVLFTFIGIIAVSLLYFFFFHWGKFNDIRTEKGIVSSILSFRDELLINNTIPFITNNWQWPNYLFGGISDLATRSQLGFIDIFLFWGILGGLLYLFVYCKAFIPKSMVKNGYIIVIVLGVMVFLAGNFFENASVAIYLLILKEILTERPPYCNNIQLNEQNQNP
ncbi:hypothetical protein [Aequorivita echinoideorum]|uniref:O-Antigen ligase n=1 Tax=Aequorivita echinoideorum TaxID=1549647 RepID=A0ABS5S1T1_9FLAO|nr:hypothetical protein [Aequorivita echinoideorum]MBT0607162.1 hypothetical protein [Aequorivita echinoideorum]